MCALNFITVWKSRNKSVVAVMKHYFYSLPYLLLFSFSDQSACSLLDVFLRFFKKLTNYTTTWQIIIMIDMLLKAQFLTTQHNFTSLLVIRDCGNTFSYSHSHSHSICSHIFSLSLILSTLFLLSLLPLWSALSLSSHTFRDSHSDAKISSIHFCTSTGTKGLQAGSRGCIKDFIK